MGAAPRIRVATPREMVTAEQARSCLEQVKDAGSGRSALELGWIDQVRVAPPRVVFRLSLPGFAQSQRERIAAEAKELLSPGRHQRHPDRTRTAPSQGGIGQAAMDNNPAKVPAFVSHRRQQWQGGVGKSTVAVNLACALARQGKRSACSTPTSTAPMHQPCWELLIRRRR